MCMQLPHDPLKTTEVIDYVDNILVKLNYAELDNFGVTQFESGWRTWLSNSTYNKIHGLDSMKHCAFCPGTTDAFGCLLYTSPSPRDRQKSRMPSSA